MPSEEKALLEILNTLGGLVQAVNGLAQEVLILRQKVDYLTRDVDQLAPRPGQPNRTNASMST